MKSLSVVMVAATDRARASRSLRAIGRQTVAKDLEILVVDRHPSLAPLTADGVEFESIRAEGRTFTQARILGLERATADAVAYVEDHAYASPDWAEALIEAHKGPYVAIGYSFQNANPETYLARASMVAEYGFWQGPAFRGPSTSLTSHNISYKREALLSLGDRLETLMTPDQILFEHFARRGQPMFVEGRARIAHENRTDFASLVRINFLYGRLHAGHRAKVFGWSTARRCGVGILSPATGIGLRLPRLARAMRSQPGGLIQFASAFPVILASYTATGLGAAVGYLFGHGRTEERFNRLEGER